MLKFNKHQFSDDIITDFIIFFQGDIILCQREKIIMLCPDCDTSESDLVSTEVQQPLLTKDGQGYLGDVQWY